MSDRDNANPYDREAVELARQMHAEFTKGRPSGRTGGGRRRNGGDIGSFAQAPTRQRSTIGFDADSERNRPIRDHVYRQQVQLTTNFDDFFPDARRQPARTEAPPVAPVVAAAAPPQASTVATPTAANLRPTFVSALNPTATSFTATSSATLSPAAGTAKVSSIAQVPVRGLASSRHAQERETAREPPVPALPADVRRHMVDWDPVAKRWKWKNSEGRFVFFTDNTNDEFQFLPNDQVEDQGSASKDKGLKSSRYANHATTPPQNYHKSQTSIDMDVHSRRFMGPGPGHSPTKMRKRPSTQALGAATGEQPFNPEARLQQLKAKAAQDGVDMMDLDAHY